MKLVWAEGALYTIISMATPWSLFLASDHEISTRSLCCIAVGSIIAGATAAKAFLSQSFANYQSDPPPHV